MQTEEIKRRVSVADVLSMYGIEAKKRIPCRIHGGVKNNFSVRQSISNAFLTAKAMIFLSWYNALAMWILWKPTSLFVSILTFLIHRITQKENNVFRKCQRLNNPLELYALIKKDAFATHYAIYALLVVIILWKVI